MARLFKEYDADKLEELKNRISEREKELFDEINNALGNKDEEQYRYLKQLQLQCTAELRLIKYIENCFKGDFMIC